MHTYTNIVFATTDVVSIMIGSDLFRKGKDQITHTYTCHIQHVEGGRFEYYRAPLFFAGHRKWRLNRC